MCQVNRIPATFFEMATAMGFLHYHKQSCQSVVLEVGLGGRLDSTNVFNPSIAVKPYNLSIITAIQLDHVKILGDSIEKIAMENFDEKILQVFLVKWIKVKHL